MHEFVIFQIYQTARIGTSAFRDNFLSMLYIVASFLILILSVASLCILCAKLVLVIVEQGKLWGRRKIHKLMPTFICISLSVAHIIDLLIYAVEVAPSILVGQPAYGSTTHTIMGWCSLVTFYASTLQMFVLSSFKSKLIIRRKLKHQTGIVKGSIVGCWIMGVLLTAVVHHKICHYTMVIDNYFSYQCDNDDKKNTFRLAALNGTFCGALLLLIIFSLAYHYYESRGTVNPADPQQESETSVATISGCLQQNTTNTSNVPMNFSQVLSKWYLCLSVQVVLCMVRVASMLAILTIEPNVWLGFVQTIIHIIYCSLSDYLYLKIFGIILNYMYTVELKNAVQSSLIQFRLWTSHRSLHNSFRESCRSFHQTQMYAKNTAKATVGVSKNVAKNKTLRNFPEDSFMATIPDTDSLTDAAAPSRIGIPIVHVEVYRNKEDSLSLRNYDSDDSTHSLHERISRISAGTSNSSLTSYSFSDHVDMLHHPETLIRSAFSESNNHNYNVNQNWSGTYHLTPEMSRNVHSHLENNETLL